MTISDPEDAERPATMGGRPRETMRTFYECNCTSCKDWWGRFHSLDQQIREAKANPNHLERKNAAIHGKRLLKQLVHDAYGVLTADNRFMKKELWRLSDGIKVLFTA